MDAQAQDSEIARPRLAAIHIHFDSLNEALGFPPGFTDKSFFEVAERFLAVARELDFKYTISVIGKDLENGAHREAVQEWARQGHEIGNHSWSHYMDLGTLWRQTIVSEVSRSHERIAKACGMEPKGFVAPAWSFSPELYDVLLDLGYEYDSSPFPSWLLLPLAVRVAIAFRGSEKATRILRRSDYRNCFTGNRDAFLYSPMDPASDGTLRVLPLPTNRYRFPCWHTVGSVFGWSVHRRMLASCLNDIEAFYYVMHPADVLVQADLPRGREKILPRCGGDLDEKLMRVRNAISQIKMSGRQLVPMIELAKASLPVSTVRDPLAATA